MEWLMKLAAEREQAAHERDLMKKGAEEIWRALKQGLRTAAATYNRLYPTTNPVTEMRYDETAATQPKLKRVKLDALGQENGELDSVTVQYHVPATISAIYANGKAIFLTVVKGKTGYATLQYDEDEITLDRGCELIAGPVMFDDLKHI